MPQSDTIPPMRIQLAIAAVLAGGAIATLIAWQSVRIPLAGENVYNKLAGDRFFRERLRDVAPITDYTPPATQGAVSKDGYTITKFAVPGGVRAFLRPEPMVDDALVGELGGRFRSENELKRAIEVERAALLSLSERELLEAIFAADPALLKQEDETSAVIRKALLLTAVNPVETVLAWKDRPAYAMTYARSGEKRDAIVIVFQFDDEGNLILNARVTVSGGTPPERVRGAITALLRSVEPAASATTSAPLP